MRNIITAFKGTYQAANIFHPPVFTRSNFAPTHSPATHVPRLREYLFVLADPHIQRWHIVAVIMPGRNVWGNKDKRTSE